MTLLRVLRWLLHGSDEMFMPRTWMENHKRLRAYEGYTRRQLEQGSVVSDVAAMRRREFWRVVAMRSARVSQRASVTPFIAGGRR